MAATTLRNVLGTKNLAEILSERETISQVMQNALDEATDPWGVKVRLLSLIFVKKTVFGFRPFLHEIIVLLHDDTTEYIKIRCPFYIDFPLDIVTRIFFGFHVI